MSLKQFKDVSDGEVFKTNNIEYKKIPQVRVSCCRSLNAESIADANQKIFVQPTTEVEVNDQL